MFGKGALIYVAAISMIFSLYQMQLSKLTVEASSAFNRRYMETILHENAMNAMNIGINHVWADDAMSDTLSIIAPPCTSLVVIDTLGLDTVFVKVTTITAVYDEEQYATDGKALSLRDSIYAYFAYHTPVSNYFWFVNTAASNIYWISGDTVEGPMHCNSAIKTSGSPVFYGKVTARLGFSPSPTSRRNRAKYYGGWEVGVDVSLPTDMTPLHNAAVAGNAGATMNTKCLYDVDISLEFLPNGNVIRIVDGGAPDTVSVASIAPTGVIYCAGDIHVQGTLNGSVTLYSGADIWIDNDMVYADDPRANPNSNDLLGLVSADDVIITNNAANNSDININASIMAGDKFYAEDYSTRPNSGALNLTGSIGQNERGPVGTFSWWSGEIATGFSKRYHYDLRLAAASPPNYPFVRALKLVAWWE